MDLIDNNPQSNDQSINHSLSKHRSSDLNRIKKINKGKRKTLRKKSQILKKKIQLKL